MIKNKTSIDHLINAQEALESALQLPYNDIVRDSCIKRFEFSFELAWKITKKKLFTRGIEVNSPKSTFREAAKEGLIDNVESWFEFLENRNLSTDIYDDLEDFNNELKKLISNLKQYD